MQYFIQATVIEKVLYNVRCFFLLLFFFNGWFFFFLRGVLIGLKYESSSKVRVLEGKENIASYVNTFFHCINLTIPTLPLKKKKNKK